MVIKILHGVGSMVYWLRLMFLSCFCWMPFCCNTVNSQDTLENIRQRGRLVWGGDKEGGGPFMFPAPDDPNKLIGFEVDIVQMLADHLGVEAEFHQGEWGKLPDVLNRGDIDILLSGYEWSSERAERFGFSIPYYIFELQLLGRVGDDSLQNWQDLIPSAREKKKRIAVLSGSTAQEYMEKNFGDSVELVHYDGSTDAMRGVELRLDGVDANLQDLPIWIFFRNGFPDLRTVGAPVRGGYYSVLTRKEDESLLNEINIVIRKALQDGRLRTILTKYDLWNQTQASRGLETNSRNSFIGDQFVTGHEALGNESKRVESFEAVRGWKVIEQRGWLLVKAAGMTALLAVLAMPLAILLGLVLAIARLYGPRWMSWLAITYIELVRGTPLVLQLYVIFFLLPELGLSISAFAASIIGLAINYSAYEAEIYRAGIQAIPEGQIEAATALGMSRGLTLRRVVIPQATRMVIPPMTNDFIALFKDTAVCSVITVVELSKEYYIHARSTGAILELGLLTGVLYLAMSYPLAVLAGRLEQKLKPEVKR